MLEQTAQVQFRARNLPCQNPEIEGKLRVSIKITQTHLNFTIFLIVKYILNNCRIELQYEVQLTPTCELG